MFFIRVPGHTGTFRPQAAVRAVGKAVVRDRVATGAPSRPPVVRSGRFRPSVFPAAGRRVATGCPYAAAGRALRAFPAGRFPCGRPPCRHRVPIRGCLPCAPGVSGRPFSLRPVAVSPPGAPSRPPVVRSGRFRPSVFPAAGRRVVIGAPSRLLVVRSGRFRPAVFPAAGRRVATGCPSVAAGRALRAFPAGRFPLRPVVSFACRASCPLRGLLPSPLPGRPKGPRRCRYRRSRPDRRLRSTNIGKIFRSGAGSGPEFA